MSRSNMINNFTVVIKLLKEDGEMGLKVMMMTMMSMEEVKMRKAVAQVPGLLTPGADENAKRRWSNVKVMMMLRVKRK